jgi:hypothetical protein
MFERLVVASVQLEYASLGKTELMEADAPSQLSTSTSLCAERFEEQ